MPNSNSSFNVELRNPCSKKKDHCLNCHSHFMAVRPNIHSVVVTKRFLKDLKKKEKAEQIVKDILDCSNADFYELHKFEKHVAGCMVFRAKTEGLHIVYCVDKKMRIIFMRIFKNFKAYEKFLDDNKEISKLVTYSGHNSGGVNFLTENTNEKIVTETEEVQDEVLKKEKGKKKARLRKRGPYRKAHANW